MGRMTGVRLWLRQRFRRSAAGERAARRIAVDAVRFVERRARVRKVSTIVALAWLAGCGADLHSDLRGVVVVGAASDLTRALPALVAAFEAETGVRVSVTLGSSGQLAQQVLQGAPIDVLLSADADWVDRLEAAGRIEPATRAVYGIGVLVLVAGRQRQPPSSLGELVDPVHARIALANAEHAPYGRAARQALERAGVYAQVSHRLVLAENARQAVVFAESGAVDAAISALPLMDSTRHRWVTIPAALHDPLQQTAVIISGSARREAAAAFVAFLVGPQGREILARHRFVLP